MRIDLSNAGEGEPLSMQVDGEDVDLATAGFVVRRTIKGDGAWLDRTDVHPGRRLYDLTIYMNGTAAMRVPPYSKEQELVYIEMEQDD